MKRFSLCVIPGLIRDSEIKVVLLLIFLILLSACGKKQPNIFDFSPKKEFCKVSKFDLGFVKNLKVTKTDRGYTLFWQELAKQNLSLKYKNAKIQFLGYDIYRLVRSSIIPKKSLNDFPIKETEFVDTQILSLSKEFVLENPCYVVVPIFNVDGRTVKGLISQVICAK